MTAQGTATVLYEQMSTDDLRAQERRLWEQYEEFKARGLSLNMARGKPEAAQLDLSRPMLEEVNSHSDFIAEDGTDCRNYGALAGIPEARRLMGDILGVSAENVIVGGNSSLAMMYDAVGRAYTHGVMGSTPWCRLPRVKWICPVPGYDRHFALTDHFGFELITVPLTGHGPDMDLVERLIQDDDSVKGMWCVPKYSNPTGETYSDETVRRIAALKPAARDFRIYWDNAYVVHHLYEEPERQDQLLEIFAECENAGNPNLVYEFASTSKITFPGAGIACMAASQENIKDALDKLQYHTIGYDKLNQLRHVRFLCSRQGTVNHMMRHAAIIRPKFEMTIEIFERELRPTGTASWTNPNGGYFISFNAMPGCAREIVDLAAQAGLKLTGAGATYPHHIDPQNSNIRIAPTFPSRKELATCIELFVLCVKLVSTRRILATRG